MGLAQYGVTIFAGIRLQIDSDSKKVPFSRLNP